MIKKILFFVFLCVLSVNGVKYHQDSRGAEIHTPFRWIVADSTARMALSVAAADTQKFCFQLADTSIWVLIDNSPKNWAWVSGKKADSLWIRTFQAVTAGITRINTDSSDNRIITADSATIPVLKGAKTIRDTTTFTGGAYFAGIGRFAGTLYAPVVDIDSIAGPLAIAGAVSVSQIGDAITSGLNLKSYTGSSYWRIASISTGKLYISWNSTSYTTIDSTGKIEHLGNITATTLNTGNGDCEVYPHITGSFPCTLKTSDVTVQQIGTAYWTKIGNVFTCTFPYLSGESNSAFLRVYCSVPYLPRASVIAGCNARNNGTTVAAYGGVASSVVDYVDISLYGSGFTGSGTKTVFSHSVTYVTAN